MEDLKKASKHKELGRIGQLRSGGRMYEEFLPELRGKRGTETFYEMSENDDMVGAMLFAIEKLILGIEWSVSPASEKSEDKKAAKFVESCMHDMSDTWFDTISEILSMLIYGWSAHEIVYKRRFGRRKDRFFNSKYNDGLIGWQKLPIRSQNTLYEWLYEEGTDNLIGMRQMPPPDYGIIDIPIEKLLLFRTTKKKGNPEGRSILRNAYRSWYFKKRIQEIEGMGIERDLAGFPVLYAPPQVDIWDESDPDMVRQLGIVIDMVTKIRRDKQEGTVLPDGWKLELLTSGGTRQFDTNKIIERYDTRIAMTVLADFILLGHQSTGTYSLGTDKSQMFSVAIGSWLDTIAEVFNNKAVPALIDINGDVFKGITDYPKLIHGEIENRNLTELGDFLKALSSVGVMLDKNQEDYLFQAAKMPARIETEV
ncbi:MAG: hypothetical protein Q4G33_04540 [bacterium]|nr:hypothetical protein [bacterium]